MSRAPTKLVANACNSCFSSSCIVTPMRCEILEKNFGDETNQNSHFDAFRNLCGFSFDKCVTMSPIADNSCASGLRLLP